MPSVYQQENLQAMLGLFLEGQGIPLPEHCEIKSEECIKPIFKRIPMEDAASD